MSAPTRHELLEWSQDALITTILQLQDNATQHSDTIASRRNRLLTEENESFRRQLEELNSLKSDFYDIKGQNCRFQIDLEESNNRNHHLNQENASLREQIEQIKEFQSTFEETQHQLQQLQLQNTSLYEELDRRKKEDALRSQSGMTVDALTREIDSLKSENKNLQDDLLREERLHCNKYQEIWSKLNEYQTKYSDLLQRYSSMESFVEEFCEDANQSDDDNDIAMQQLTKWTHLLHQKQEGITQEIESRIEYGLQDMKHELNQNRQEMHQMQHDMARNVASSLVHDVVTSAVAISNENMVNNALHQVSVERDHLESARGEIQSESAKIEDNKRMMESQLTQLHGQKLLISNLNKTIEDLCEKVKEYEHHIHRLTFQLKQLSLINKAQQECNTDFNVQQIQTLSTNLMEKEVECDQLQSNVKAKEKEITAMTHKIANLEEKGSEQQEELVVIRGKYKDLEAECREFDTQYVSLQKENHSLKQKVVSTEAAMREIENDNNLLRNEMDRATKQYNALKQKEYNFKLQEQSLKEQYQANYKKFNMEYQCLRKKISVLEEGKVTLKNEAEQYHSAMMKHKEQSRGVHLKYNQLKQEYERMQGVLEERDRKYKAIQSVNDKMKQRLEGEAIPTITRYKERNERLTEEMDRMKVEREGLRDQIQQLMMDQSMNINQSGNGGADRSEVERMKKEIDALNDQLYEGSNKRRQLRAYLLKFQEEGQLKLQKSHRRLKASKQMLCRVLRVMEEERYYVEQNQALKQQMENLREQLQPNQENRVQNVIGK